MADRQEKKNSTKPKVRHTMVKLFQTFFCISICKTLPLNLWTFQLIDFFYVNTFFLLDDFLNIRHIKGNSNLIDLFTNKNYVHQFELVYLCICLISQIVHKSFLYNCLRNNGLTSNFSLTLRISNVCIYALYFRELVRLRMTYRPVLLL